MAKATMPDICALIMMAGKGTRMKSGVPKVLHHACGQPIGQWVLDVCDWSGIKNRIIVVGHEAETVSAAFPGETFVLQEPQLGTGHAVMIGFDVIPASSKHVLVLSGDVPCLNPETVRAFIKLHRKNACAASLLSFYPPDPAGYGRIIRNGNDELVEIIEHKDLKGWQKEIDECNSGIYLLDKKELGDDLKNMKPNKRSGEYHLPDVIRIFLEKGKTIKALPVQDWMETIGVNSRYELAEAGDYLRWRTAEHHMSRGVTLMDPGSIWIGPRVHIGSDVTIMPGSIIMGETKIGDGCVIGPYSQLTDATVGKQAVIRQSVLLECRVDDEVTIGPFAHIRPGTRLRKGSHVGNFVEFKKTDFGEGSKAGHLTYLGDTEVGKKVNIGAGTITCNYDGKNKYRTKIGDGTFIGSDSILVAPLNIGKNAYTAAGSAISEDVPDNSLAFGRSRQVVKKGWMLKNKKKQK